MPVFSIHGVFYIPEPEYTFFLSKDSLYIWFCLKLKDSYYHLDTLPNIKFVLNDNLGYIQTQKCKCILNSNQITITE